MKNNSLTQATTLKEYYTAQHPSDTEGNALEQAPTFLDLFECLDNYRDVYELIGVGDSLIRERLFEALAEVMRCDYNAIYNQWQS